MGVVNTTRHTWLQCCYLIVPVKLIRSLETSHNICVYYNRIVLIVNTHTHTHIHSQLVVENLSRIKNSKVKKIIESK